MIIRPFIFILSLLCTLSLLPAQTQSPVEQDSSTPTDEPDPNRFIPGVKQPKEINLADIQKKIGYPTIPKNTDIDGDIVFRVLIDENGCYIKHLPSKNGTPILVKAVEEYLPEIRFTPATKDGIPIKFWITVPFRMCFLH